MPLHFLHLPATFFVFGKQRVKFAAIFLVHPAQVILKPSPDGLLHCFFPNCLCFFSKASPSALFVAQVLLGNCVRFVHNLFQFPSQSLPIRQVKLVFLDEKPTIHAIGGIFYKQFIFPLLFFKRMCDVYDEEYAAALAESGGDADYASFAENTRGV